MRQDQPTRTHKRQELIEIVHVSVLISVDEGDVYGALQLCDLHMSITFNHRNLRLHSGLFEVLPGRRCPCVIDLECDQAAASPLEGQAKPQARVTGRFPDLNNAFAANCFIE